MLGGIGGQEEKGTTEDEMAGWHHWLDGDMSFSELQKLVMDREAWCTAIHVVTKSQTRLSDWTELTFIDIIIKQCNRKIHWKFSWTLLKMIKNGKKRRNICFNQQENPNQNHSVLTQILIWLQRNNFSFSDQMFSRISSLATKILSGCC